MNEFDKNYLETHDIDWFCKIGNTAMHFASNGGELPEKVNDRKLLRKIQHAVAIRDCVLGENEIVINRSYVWSLLRNNESRESFNFYVESFITMARKGFVSFDKMPGKDTYMWIAKPAISVDVNIQGLPEYEEDACRLYAAEKNIVHVCCLNGKWKLWKAMK
jgi:hypothetical protein